MSDPSTAICHLSWRSIFVLAAAVGATALGLRVMGQIIDVLLLCFAGGLLGLFLHGTGSWLARRAGVGRTLMVGAVCVVLVGLITLMTCLAAPAVAAQVDELSTTLPRALDNATAPLEQFSWGRSALEALRHPNAIIGHREAWSSAGGVVSTTFGRMGGLFVVLFIGIFLAFDPDPYLRGFLRLVPSNRRNFARDCLALVSHSLRMWMVGKLASMAVVGLATWAGLALLDVPLAMLLAILAAVLTFVPNFGPLMSAIPAVLLGFLQSPMNGVWVIGLYVAVQTVESYLLTPLMQKQMVALPPALTLVAQVMMGTLAGGLGLVVATPLSAAALVLVGQAYEKAGQEDGERASS
jgi:predicted PurR-regulated permease PerM